MNQKLEFLCFRGIHNSLPSFSAKLGYSWIKIGVHLLSDELSQLPALDRTRCIKNQNYLECGVKAYKVRVIDIPFTCDESQDIFFTMYVFSLLFAYNLPLVTNLESSKICLQIVR